MSTTAKKKPADFKSLDLSKVVATNPVVPAPIEGLDKEVKPKVTEGYWINGKDLKEVSPQEFKQWLIGMFPNVDDVAKMDLKSMTTPDQREKLILRVVDLFRSPNLRSKYEKEKKYLA